MIEKTALRLGGCDGGVLTLVVQGATAYVCFVWKSSLLTSPLNSIKFGL